ncbi:MAG: hypothetical protein KDI32_05525 [Pseudomonadales bacterium]|nr:hypothetical protein [Pseudomonadales bacterium]
MANDVQVQPVADLREYFRDALHVALSHQHIAVEDQTEHYVVNLLTIFARADQLFEQTPAGPRLTPLVVMLSQALEAPNHEERCRGLQRLGDVSLFVAGFFAQGFATKLVDIDYHIAMGGRAYGTLAETLRAGRRRTLGQVFGELAQKFQPMVDALNEISETAYRHSHDDLLRLYEVWIKTGSERSRAILRRLGVEPVHSPNARLAH